MEAQHLHSFVGSSQQNSGNQDRAEPYAESFCVYLNLESAPYIYSNQKLIDEQIFIQDNQFNYSWTISTIFFLIG